MRLAALAGALLLIGASPDVELPATSGPVPAALPGARVVHTAAVAALLASPGVVLLDVSELPRRPATLAPGAPWLPPEHRDIPGSVWIPGAGRNPAPPELEQYFRSRLAELTLASPERPIVVYCHPNCWGSWVAGKRALAYGYRNVFWYPDGIEGWEDAHLPTAPATPEGPAGRATFRLQRALPENGRCCVSPPTTRANGSDAGPRSACGIASLARYRGL